jgi:hypothetical protein
MLSPAAKTERVETRGATERRATTASAAALGAATGDTRSSHGDGWKREAARREPTGNAAAAWRDVCRAHGHIPFRARSQTA